MGGEVGGWVYLYVLDHEYMYARTHFQVSDRLAAISEMTIRDLPRVEGKCRRRARAGMLVCGWLGAGEEPVQMWMQALSALTAPEGIAAGGAGGSELGGWSPPLRERELCVLRWEVGLLQAVGEMVEGSGGRGLLRSAFGGVKGLVKDSVCENGCVLG